VAVVGTRLPTPYGRKVTEMIVEGLVANGLIIVSGLARGVDAIAHRTTIFNKGLTVGVLACGLDKVYPPEHRGLVEEIVKSGGVVISEMPLGMMPVRGNFPARNRIISGLSLGVVVTEAAQDSGSLITANFAKKFKRKVFAVPGQIISSVSIGTNRLIKEGAEIVTEANDVLKYFNTLKMPETKHAEARPLYNLEGRVIQQLQREPMEIDFLARNLNIGPAELGKTISLMEIKGQIKNENGKYYVC